MKILARHRIKAKDPKDENWICPSKQAKAKSTAAFAFNAENDLTPIRRFLLVEYTNQLQTDMKNIKRKAITR